MENSLRGRRALVTAGAAGIGRAIAAAFAQHGARIHICDIDEAALGRMKSEMPAVSQTRADVASLADVERLFADAQRQLGGLDILVNNAGIAGFLASDAGRHISGQAISVCGGARYLV